MEGMDKNKVTPKDFFFWAGAMVALYWSVISFIYLVFNYIDYTFPTPTTFSPIDPYESGVGHEMASVVVMLPIYLVLMWLIHRDIHRDSSRKHIWVRRWALIFTLFVTAITIAIDLVTVLTTFFNGESFTLSFILKAVLVLLVAATVFMHFIADLWGYWDQYPQRQRSVAIGVLVLMLATIVAGFFIIGTPAQALRYREDEQKVSDLQQIQSQVISYWQQNGALPSSLDKISQPLTGGSLPIDQQAGQEYSYSIVNKTTFKLCATFNATTAPYAITQNELTIPVAAPGGQRNDAQTSWFHDAGQQCFTRIIDPSQYPRINVNAK